MTGRRRRSATRKRTWAPRLWGRRLKRAMIAVREGKLAPAELTGDLREAVLSQQAKEAAEKAQRELG